MRLCKAVFLATVEDRIRVGMHQTVAGGFAKFSEIDADYPELVTNSQSITQGDSATTRLIDEFSSTEPSMVLRR